MSRRKRMKPGDYSYQVLATFESGRTKIYGCWSVDPYITASILDSKNRIPDEKIISMVQL